MEIENKENIDVQEAQENEKGKKNKYSVHIKYDTEILKMFAKFYNSVKHPRATAYMFFVGITLFALPFVNDEIKLPGLIVCYVIGPLLFLLSLFRHNISVMMMKDTPEMKVGEDIVYRFTNTGVQVDKSGQVQYLGVYKKIYRLWESEKVFYVGMNEDDLLVLPKDKFEEGDVDTFREFIVEKSTCIFTWKPSRIDNVIKWKIMQFKTGRMQKKLEEANEEAEKK